MLTEKEIDFLEQQIPILAAAASNQAYWRTLSAGGKVMIAENGYLIEVSSDGTRKILKEIEKPVKVKKRIYKLTK